MNFDDINLDDVTQEEADESSQETLRKKPGPKKRTGPRIKNTKDKKEKKKAKAIPTIGKRGPYKKGDNCFLITQAIHNLLQACCYLQFGIFEMKCNP